MEEFHRIARLPSYVFAVVEKQKMEARRRGEDIVDFGMGNPDGPTPQHIVDKVVEAVKDPRNHRYSASRGIYKLRLAICDWYKRRFGVELDPEGEAIATIGSKEGLSHLFWAMIAPGDVVLAPTPAYPIHQFGVVLAGGNVVGVPMHRDRDFFEDLRRTYEQTWPRARLLIVNFPHNPTTLTVELPFFERLVDFARAHELLVVQDLAYADITFDGYQAPSILQVPGAKDVAIEFFSMSKSYNMPGWRVGFACGNRRMVNALTRIKSYLDYGIFQPVQIASIIALNESDAFLPEIRQVYQSRRDCLIPGLERAGWPIEPPRGTMFAWAPVPEAFRPMGSLKFAEYLLREAKVAVSPGIGFGDAGDDHVRFALVENEHRTRQAIRGIKRALEKGPEAAQAA
jgi:alanine-synthesizing transaminase